MTEFSELAVLRILILVCTPGIVMITLSPISWTIASFCKAFKEDQTSPSFVVSYLWEQSEWYVSIVRYKEKYAGGRYTFMSGRHSWLTVAVASLIFQWVGFWFLNVVRPGLKTVKEKVISLLLGWKASLIKVWNKKVGDGKAEKQNLAQNLTQAVSAYNFDLFLSERQWNATQKMFISALKTHVAKNGRILDPSDLDRSPYYRIGDVRKLFTDKQRHELYKLAGCSQYQILDYEQRPKFVVKHDHPEWVAKGF